ncbi:MAG TPA: spore germination protein GerW family protein [Solirubrobacteraceae bacterium]|jgi:uncharacterized spore protein YtfJ|nr:spore germination protein GerW family protein [Solirubrobacteraceae bacterium]
MAKDKDKPDQRPGVEEPRLFSVRRLLADISGARLCFGDQVRSGDRVMIPVSRMRVAGGGGFGSGQGEDDAGLGTGGGGGGFLEATPVGYLDTGPEGTRFVAIPDPDRPARLLGAVAKLLPAVLATAAGVRALRSGDGLGGLPRAFRRRGATLKAPSPRRLLRR